MEDLFNELLLLLEKTIVIIEFDRTKIDYMNYSQSDVEAGIKPNEEDRYFSYTVMVDGYSNLIKYSKRVDYLIQEFIKEIDSQVNNRVYYKNIKTHLEKIKSIVVPVYSNLEISSFLDQADIRERGIGNKSSYYFEPNIYLKYINGTELDTDFGEFQIIKKFIEKKFYLARRIEAITKSNLELLKESRGTIKTGTLRFQNEKLLKSPNLDHFRLELIKTKLIDHISISKFERCFSGKEVEQKINWIDYEVSLVFFIKRIENLKLIDPKKKWVALSNSFLLNSNPIFHDKISHTTADCKIETKKKITNCINAFLRKQYSPNC
jgi:hypothetical protein